MAATNLHAAAAALLLPLCRGRRRCHSAKRVTSPSHAFHLATISPITIKKTTRKCCTTTSVYGYKLLYYLIRMSHSKKRKRVSAVVSVVSVSQFLSSLGRRLLVIQQNCFLNNLIHITLPSESRSPSTHTQKQCYLCHKTLVSPLFFLDKKFRCGINFFPVFPGRLPTTSDCGFIFLSPQSEALRS